MSFLEVSIILVLALIVSISRFSPVFKGMAYIGLGIWILTGMPEATACDDVVVVEACDPGFTCSDEPEPEIAVVVDILEEIER